MLQFGHGGEAVEIESGLCGWCKARRLQFGHGGEAVEIETGDTGCNSFTSFNSATAVKPWRCRDRRHDRRQTLRFNSATAVKPWRSNPAVCLASELRKLQFGHGGEAVEI